MINVLKPHAVYTFVKLVNMLQIKVLVVPMTERKGEPWVDLVRRYDPQHMADYTCEEITKLTTIVQRTSITEGWRFSNWHIAQLDSASHKPGMYEDIFSIQIGTNEPGT